MEETSRINQRYIPKNVSLLLNKLKNHQNFILFWLSDFHLFFEFFLYFYDLPFSMNSLISGSTIIFLFYSSFFIISIDALQCFNGIRSSSLSQQQQQPTDGQLSYPIFCQTAEYCVKMVDVQIGDIAGTFFGCAGEYVDTNHRYRLNQCFVSAINFMFVFFIKEKGCTQEYGEFSAFRQCCCRGDLCNSAIRSMGLGVISSVLGLLFVMLLW